jgi:ATP10 protein
MQRFSTVVPLVIGLLIVARPVNAAHSTAAPLHIGDVFPQFSGQTLTGKSLTLPTSAADKSAVLIFSFHRATAKDARLWNEHLARDFPKAILIYALIMLESAPKLFRGMAISGIKSSMPWSVQDRTIVSFQDEELWKQRLTDTNDGGARVLLLGPDGHIHWMNSGAYTDAEYAHLKNDVSRLTQPNP